MIFNSKKFKTKSRILTIIKNKLKNQSRMKIKIHKIIKTEITNLGMATDSIIKMIIKEKVIKRIITMIKIMIEEIMVKNIRIDHIEEIDNITIGIDNKKKSGKKRRKLLNNNRIMIIKVHIVQMQSISPLSASLLFFYDFR